MVTPSLDVRSFVVQSVTFKVLSTCFPELKVQITPRRKFPSGYWKKIDNQRTFLETLAPKLSVNKRSDWYNISVDRILKSGGSGLITKYNGSLISALRAIYPDTKWSDWKLGRPHHVRKGLVTFSKEQYLLFQVVKSVSCTKYINFIVVVISWISSRVKLWSGTLERKENSGT